MPPPGRQMAGPSPPLLWHFLTFSSPLADLSGESGARAQARVAPVRCACEVGCFFSYSTIHFFFLWYCPSVCCFLIVLLFLPSPSRFKYTFFIALLSLKRKRKLEEGALIITLSSAITRVSFVCCSGAAFFYFCDSSLARSY